MAALITAPPRASDIPGPSAPTPLPRWAPHPWRRLSFAHWENGLIIGILLVAATAHGWNMFNFPYYENDEGTYVSQAWSVLTQGQLAPYTYWYDHAPGGWLQLALWTMISGGFYTFGMSVDSGRVLMLLMQLASTFMLYRIARASSRSALVATIAALAFAVSPYGIYFHRRVLLDNIATFWMLLSIMLLVCDRLTLSRVWLAGVALGVSILSKELTIFLLPALLYLVFVRSHPSHRIFAIVGWLTIVGSVFSLWFLMAVVKSELFPSGTWLGGQAEHVSLLGTLQYQLSRGKDGGLTQLDSGFWRWVRTWAVDDPFLVIFGSLGAVVSLLAVRWNRVVFALGVATLSLWAFLARGGEVIGFYLVPLLPLLAWGAGILLGAPATGLARWLSRRGGVGGIASGGVVALCMCACLALFIPGYSSPNLGFASNGWVLWSNRQADAQRNSLAWVRTYVEPSQTLVMEDYLWTDLHDRRGSGPGYDAAHWYWKVDFDPDIRDRVLHGDWRTVDYVIGTPQMWGDIQNAVPKLELVGAVARHATLVARFDTGGWPVEVLRANKPQSFAAPGDPVLRQMWAEYIARFVHSGQVIEPAADHRTTAVDQSSALLRAVYLDDRSTFDELWRWTQAELQVRDAALLAGGWGGGPDRSQQVLDPRSTAAADQDAALALLFAARRWNAPEYHQAALGILNGIWEKETLVVAGRRVMLAGDWARADANQPIVKPSTLAPYAYRIFAQADPDHTWLDLVDSSYALLEQIRASAELGGTLGLAPDWISLDGQTGAVLPAEAMGPASRNFSGEAGRLLWRLALDWLWFQEPRAQAALQGLSFPRQQLERDGRLLAAYAPDGRPATDAESISMYAGTLAGILVSGNPDLACRLLTEKVLRPYLDQSEGSPRADPDNGIDATSAWFAAALFDGGLANLWAGDAALDWEAALPALPAGE